MSLEVIVHQVEENPDRGFVQAEVEIRDEHGPVISLIIASDVRRPRGKPYAAWLKTIAPVDWKGLPDK